MAFIALSTLTIVTLILCRLLVTKWQQRMNVQRVLQHDGCEDPPSYPHKDSLGKDLHELSMEAFKQHRFLDFTEELFNKYGKTFRTMNDGKVWIKTKDPELSKAIYTTFFEKFGLEPIRYEKGGFFGDGILVVDGARWKSSRGLIRPAFEIAHIANFDRLHRHVNRFLEILPSDGSTVDLLPILKRLVRAEEIVTKIPDFDQVLQTLDLSTEFIFGKPMNALSSPEACAHFIRAFTAAQRGVVISPSDRDDEWKECCNHVNSYIDDRVEEAFSRVKNGIETAVHEKRYVRIVDEMAKVTKDKEALRYQVLSVFSPAHDTVAVTLGNLFFHIARHPSVWGKLREEMIPTAEQPLTYQLLNSYKYLNWALRESKNVSDKLINLSFTLTYSKHID
jgi:cytochrome P450